MAATPAQTLFGEGACLACYGSPSQAQLLRLTLLTRILTSLNPVASTDVQTLLQDGNCFACYTNGSTADTLELVLLDQISQNIGGAGGGGNVAPGVPDPEGVVTGSPGQTYYATGTNTYWLKQSGTGTNTGWTQLI